MLRTLVITSLLLAATTTAAAQEAPPPPSTYGAGPAATTAPATPTTTLYASGSPGYVAPNAPAATTGSYSVFPPRDRQGRVLMGTRHELADDRGMWGAGLGLFLAGWVLDIVGTAIFNAASNDRGGALEEDAMAWSLLPWAGPFIQLGLEAPHPALPITSGLLQLTGTVLFVLGLTSRHDTEVPIYGWPTAHLSFDVAPTEGGAFATVSLHTM